MEATPIRTIDGDTILIESRIGEATPTDGHREHFVVGTEYDFTGVEVWVRVNCSCGKTFGGAVARARLVAESH